MLSSYQFLQGSGFLAPVVLHRCSQLSLEVKRDANETHDNWIIFCLGYDIFWPGCFLLLMLFSVGERVLDLQLNNHSVDDATFRIRIF